MEAHATQNPDLDQARKPQAASLTVRLLVVIAFLVLALGALRWARNLIVFNLDPFILGWGSIDLHTVSDAVVLLGQCGALGVLGWLILQPDASVKAQRALHVSAALWGIVALGRIVSLIVVIPSLHEYNPNLLPYLLTMLPAVEIAGALVTLAAADIAGARARQREGTGPAVTYLRGALVCIVLVWVSPMVALIPVSRATGFVGETSSVALQVVTLTLNVVALFFIYWLVKGFLDGAAGTVLATRSALVAAAQTIYFVALFGATNYAAWSYLGPKFTIIWADIPGFALAALAWAYAAHIRAQVR